MNTTSDTAHWWGHHTIDENHHAFWRIGPLHLWIQHLPNQWRFVWKFESSFDHEKTSPLSHSVPEMPRPGFEETRFAFRQNQNQLLFSPALADRPVVTRLQTPLYILSGEQLTLYVSTPLWLRVESDNPRRLVREIPSNRLSDTWFGPYTAGELCYASRTPAFLNLREVTFRLNRVTTAVVIRNGGEEPFLVDRLNLPLPRLSLFYSPRTGFWTDAVTLVSTADSDLASLRLEKQPPPEASPTQFIAHPRLAGDDPHIVFRAFHVLFKKEVDR